MSNVSRYLPGDLPPLGRGSIAAVLSYFIVCDILLMRLPHLITKCFEAEFRADSSGRGRATHRMGCGTNGSQGRSDDLGTAHGNRYLAGSGRWRESTRQPRGFSPPDLMQVGPGADLTGLVRCHRLRSARSAFDHARAEGNSLPACS